jgi:hypothetical protein
VDEGSMASASGPPYEDLTLKSVRQRTYPGVFASEGLAHVAAQLMVFMGAPRNVGRVSH